MLTVAAPAAAQSSAYVGTSLVGDILRVSRTESALTESPDGGEAIGFAIRVGSPMGAAWGIEAEFARPAAIEDNDSTILLPIITSPTILPPPGGIPRFSVPTTVRNTTISTSAWIRHDFTARSSLVYLAGLGFNRMDRETGFDPRILQITILPYDTRTISYGVRPFVGLEARLGLGEHAQLVPGLRFHGIDGGWLLRPGIGVNWQF
jgi:hypothetical protein